MVTYLCRMKEAGGLMLRIVAGYGNDTYLRRLLLRMERKFTCSIFLRWMAKYLGIQSEKDSWVNLTINISDGIISPIIGTFCSMKEYG